MFKRILFFTSLAFVMASAIPQNDDIADACTAAETRQKCKNALDPFKYDAGKVVRVMFKNREQQQEFEIPLYIGEKYRFVFNKEGLPQDVDISVFDKQLGARNRKQLYTTKGQSFDQKEIIWEPERSRKVYIHFDIPATTDVEKKGCVVFLLGYAI